MLQSQTGPSYWSAFSEEEEIVHPGRDYAARQWPNPVHAMVGPVMRGQCWAKCARGIHSRPGKRAAHQSVHGDGEADSEARNLVEGTALVHRGGEHNEDQEKCEHCLNDHPGGAREIVSQIWGAQCNSAPDIFGGDSTKQKCGGSSSGKLRDPIKQS